MSYRNSARNLNSKKRYGKLSKLIETGIEIDTGNIVSTENKNKLISSEMVTQANNPASTEANNPASTEAKNPASTEAKNSSSASKYNNISASAQPSVISSLVQTPEPDIYHEDKPDSEKPKEEDIKTILDKISKQLAIWKSSNDFKNNSDPDAKLSVGDDTYSVECVINAFLSPSKKSDCGFDKFISDNSVDFNRLIDINNIPDNFEASNKHYYNLHNFGISLAEHITQSEDYKNADDEAKLRTLNNVHQFIQQTIKYLQKHMDKFNVIDDKLLTSSYELLYLLNQFTLKRASVGIDYKEIDELYNRVIASIKDNISVYNQIKPGQVHVASTEAPETDNTLEQLKTQLEAKLVDLSKQKSSLEKNVKLINERNASLGNTVSERVKNIGKEFNKLASK